MRSCHLCPLGRLCKMVVTFASHHCSDRMECGVGWTNMASILNAPSSRLCLIQSSKQVGVSCVVQLDKIELPHHSADEPV